MAADELVAVVGEDGSVVRVVTRSMMRKENLRHRAVYVAVFDHGGRILVHRRSAAKDVWPSRWDVAIGGVLTPGESWASAARRELSEEIGIDAAPVEHVGDGTFADDDVDVIGRVFRVVHDGPFTFRDGEVVAAEMVTSEELARRLATDPFVPDSLAIVLPLIGMPRVRRPRARPSLGAP